MPCMGLVFRNGALGLEGRVYPVGSQPWDGEAPHSGIAHHTLLSAPGSSTQSRHHSAISWVKGGKRLVPPETLSQGQGPFPRLLCCLKEGRAEAPHKAWGLSRRALTSCLFRV